LLLGLQRTLCPLRISNLCLWLPLLSFDLATYARCAEAREEKAASALAQQKAQGEPSKGATGTTFSPFAFASIRHKQRVAFQRQEGQKECRWGS
jgi:hypothetical protein